MTANPGPGFITSIIGFFRDTPWPRLGLLLSFVVLVVSLLTSPLPIRNDDLMWYSLWACIYFMVENVQGSRRMNPYNSLFLTAKLLTFMGFSYLLWLPWIDTIDTSPSRHPFLSNDYVVALLFFIGMGFLVGASLNVYATFSCRRTPTRIYWYTASVLAALLWSVLALRLFGNFMSLITWSLALGVVLGPAIVGLRNS